MKSLLLVVALLITPGLWAAEVARVATFANYAPFCFYKTGVDTHLYQELIPPGQSSKLFTGLAWETVLEGFHRAGYSVHLSIVPWTRAMKMLDEGLVDAIFPAVKNEQRIKRYYFSKNLVYPENRLLLYRRAEDTRGITQLIDIRDKTTGAIRGFSYGRIWDAFITETGSNLIEVNNIRQGFDMLANGRIDALVGYELSHDYHLKSWNRFAQFSKTVAFDQARSFLLGRKDRRDIINGFDYGSEQLQKEGGAQELLRRWQLQ